MAKPIPVFVYHGIAASSSDRMAPYTVHPDVFAQHLELLQSHGYRCVTASQLATEISKTESAYSAESEERLAAITFDDGYADFVDTALPILQRAGISSTLYVTTGWMDGGSQGVTARPDERFLTWNQLYDIPADIVEIGSHSHTHPQMDTLERLMLLDEIIRSKSLLEDALQRKITSFAYPHGYNSKVVRRFVRDFGYDNATAVGNAFSHRGENPYRISRLMLFSNTSIDTFRDWLEGNGAPLASHVPNPKTIGWRTYRKTRAFITRRPGTDY